MNELVILPAFVGCALVLVLLGRHSSDAAAEGWRAYWLPSAVESEVALLEDQFARDGRLLGALQDQAVTLRASDPQSALPSVRATCALIEGVAPDRVERLAAMAERARMTAALIPVAPLSPAPFRLREVRTVAHGAAILHHFLVGASERLWLRCVALGWGVRLVAGAFRQSKRGLQMRPSVERLWLRFVHAGRDWTQLDREQLATMRTLMQMIVESGRR